MSHVHQDFSAQKNVKYSNLTYRSIESVRENLSALKRQQFEPHSSDSDDVYEFDKESCEQMAHEGKTPSNRRSGSRTLKRHRNVTFSNMKKSGNGHGGIVRTGNVKYRHMSSSIFHSHASEPSPFFMTAPPSMPTATPTPLNKNVQMPRVYSQDVTRYPDHHVHPNSLAAAYAKGRLDPNFSPKMILTKGSDAFEDHTKKDKRKETNAKGGKERPKSAGPRLARETRLFKSASGRKIVRNFKRVDSGYGTLKRNYEWDTHTYGFGNVLYVKSPPKKKNSRKKLLQYSEEDVDVVRSALTQPLANHLKLTSLPNRKGETYRMASPGPGAYYTLRDTFGSQTKGGKFPKYSTPSEIDEVVKKGSELPAPVDYGVAEKPRTIRGGNISVFSGPSDVELRIRSARKSPGPGQYAISRSAGVAGGRFSTANVPKILDSIVASKRHIPGPGKYELMGMGLKGVKGGKFATVPTDFEYQCTLRKAAMSPGPDEYQRVHLDVEAIEQFAPFGTSAPRSKSDKTLKAIGKRPSSASYDLPRWPENVIDLVHPPNTSFDRFKDVPSIPSLELFRDTDAADQMAIMLAQRDSRKFTIRLPTCEEEIQSEPSLASVKTLRESSRQQKNFTFVASTMDYPCLYWLLLEPQKPFRQALLHSIMWMHDVLVRNRVGPSVARNIKFFDADDDGYLTHHEFKAFVSFLGLELNDYQLLWLARAISKRADAVCSASDFDRFIASVNRKESKVQQMLLLTHHRSWIARWTIQRVEHGKNRVVSKQFLINPHVLRGRAVTNVAYSVLPTVLAHSTNRAHSKIYLRGIVLMTSKAELIQKNIRRKFCTNWYSKVRRAIIQLEAFFRCQLQRKRYVRMRNSSIAIQSIMRMYPVYIMYGIQRISVTQIATAWRCYAAFARYRICQKSAILIQRQARMWATRNHYKLQLASATLIQSAIRGAIARFVFLIKRASAVRIESFVRMTLARLSYLCQRQSVTQIARIARGFIQRPKYARILRATLIISTYVRMWRALHNYQVVRIATTILQSFGRMINTKRVYLTKRSAVIKVQAWNRKVMTNHKYVVKRSAAIVMQGFLRMVPMRCQWLRLRHFAFRLQTNLRGAVYRKRYLDTRKKLIRLQALSRKFLIRLRYVDVCVLQNSLGSKWKKKLLASNEKILIIRQVQLVAGFLGMSSIRETAYLTTKGRIMVTQSVRKKKDGILITTYKCFDDEIEFQTTKKGFTCSGINSKTSDLEKIEAISKKDDSDDMTEMERWKYWLSLGDDREIWFNRQEDRLDELEVDQNIVAAKALQRFRRHNLEADVSKKFNEKFKFLSSSMNVAKKGHEGTFAVQKTRKALTMPGTAVMAPANPHNHLYPMPEKAAKMLVGNYKSMPEKAAKILVEKPHLPPPPNKFNLFDENLEEKNEVVEATEDHNGEDIFHRTLEYTGEDLSSRKNEVQKEMVTRDIKVIIPEGAVCKFEQVRVRGIEYSVEIKQYGDIEGDIQITMEDSFFKKFVLKTSVYDVVKFISPSQLEEMKDDFQLLFHTICYSLLTLEPNRRDRRKMKIAIKKLETAQRKAKVKKSPPRKEKPHGRVVKIDYVLSDRSEVSSTLSEIS